MPRSSRSAQPLRYYLYISDAKLEMLFDQIDPGLLSRISAEVKVDLKLVSLTLRGRRDSGPTRMAKLKVLERYIDAHHHVGTIDEPGDSYFHGQMDMQWGRVEDDNAVWFQGFQRNDEGVMASVGLGGSLHHIIGEQPPSPGTHSGSSLYAVNEMFEGIYSSEPLLRQSITEGDMPSRWPSKIAWDGARNLPKQRLDFLAIPLAERRANLSLVGSLHIILGTPLYVAHSS